MENITYTCENCGKARTIPLWYFRQLYPEPNTKPLACSVKCGCALREKGNSVIVTCPNCGKQNTRKQAHAKRVFCDVSCYGAYRAAHPELYPHHELTPEGMARLKDRRGKKNPMYGRTGNKCPVWKGGRTKYRGKGWATIRKLIKRRDGHRCALCHKRADQVSQLDVHHIFNWTDVHCNHPHNLITTCATCHQCLIHGNGPTPSRHQLATLARGATREWLARDDFLLIVRLDLQQRRGKGLPQCVVETLGLPEYYLADTQQLPLPLFD